MRKLIATLTCAAAIAAPVAASAQRGGFHGGGFHGGGFHGGGFHGGGFHGGYHGGYHGWRGYGGWRGGYGFYPYWGFGLGLGLGGLYASEFYSPWYDYYPWTYGDYDYGYGYDGGGYDGAGYNDDAGPPAGYRDPWNQNYSAPPAPAASPGVAAQPSACGRWVWDAQANRYHWNNDNC